MNQEAKAYHSFPARNGCSSGVRAKSCTRQQKRCLQLTQAIENKEPSTYPAVIVTDFVKLSKLGRLQLTIREWLLGNLFEAEAEIRLAPFVGKEDGDCQ